MKLKELRKEFEATLFEAYPKVEIQSFFAILCDAILGYSRLESTLKSEEVITSSTVLQFREALERLQKFEPIQYITGSTEFYGLHIKVNKNTLIPRPETEELVDWIIANKSIKNETCKILDIGTGSGCIAIALAKYLPKAYVTAIDISEAALSLAKQNASQNNVAVNFITQDITTTVSLFDTYDIIVSNPPYVRDQERKMMHKNVLDFEPHTALFVSNEDPLQFYRVITKLAHSNLTSGGELFFEINEYLSKEMKSLLLEEGFNRVTIKKDILGKDRMIKAMRDE